MDSFLSDDTNAIILLCAVLGKDKAVKPLNQSEYNALALWLIKTDLRPAALLDSDNLSDAAAGSGLEFSRLKQLLDRGVQLGFAIEEWQRNGLWIISRSDKEYPARYKAHLKEKAPPLLFGAGDKNLLQGGGVAIVGSRNIDIEGEDFTRTVAEECAYSGVPVISGGARGVDQISMRAALESGGKTVGVLADNLLKASVERHARYAISEGQLLLLSPYHPQARFTVGTAMGRNKLIYALADYGLVVRADHKKGGTWAGAVEELKRENAIPVFVRTTGNVPLGNKKLLELGTVEWPSNIEQGQLVQSLAEAADSGSQRKQSQPENMSLFDYSNSSEKKETNQLPEAPSEEKQSPPQHQVTEEKETTTPPMSVYAAVLPLLQSRLKTPLTVDALAQELEVAKGQLGDWLKKAVAEGQIEKLKKPVRYLARGGK